jgi:hypothetical protein
MTQHEQGLTSEYMWNVLSLYGRGTSQNVIKLTQYRIDLLPVQEERWLGRSIIQNGCRIDYSCDEEQNIFGTVFIVNKLIRSRVINFNVKISVLCGLFETVLQEILKFH